MTRLETILPDLAARLKNASAPSLSMVSLIASEFAVRRGNVQHPLVLSVLDQLRRGKSPSPSQRIEIEALVERLDNEYFAAEEHRAGEGLHSFREARGVAAVLFACGGIPLEAALESLYEAAATVDEKEELIAVVLAALDNPKP